MQLTKEQLCEALALDYADKASRGGLNYDDAYRQYMTRCVNRPLKDLQDQHKLQGLK
tara:strand:+ start:838 stop:1008 length:171 start_codon:yes stop_codon:yes gene_type:complete